MSEETGSSTVHETLREENYYRASLVSPLSSEKSDVTEWLYVISVTLDHDALSDTVSLGLTIGQARGTNLYILGCNWDLYMLHTVHFIQCIYHSTTMVKHSPSIIICMCLYIQFLLPEYHRVDEKVLS